MFDLLHCLLRSHLEACDIYTWGKGVRSVLGHGNERDQRIPEVLVALLGRNVKLLALGKIHSIALSGKL